VAAELVERLDLRMTSGGFAGAAAGGLMVGRRDPQMTTADISRKRLIPVTVVPVVALTSRLAVSGEPR
jgi:hypothetical protein